MSNPNVEAFKVHASAELRRLLKRYVGQRNTPALRASLTEMVEAKLLDLVNQHAPEPGAVVEVDEQASTDGKLVVKLKLPLAHPFTIEGTLDDAMEDDDAE